MDTTPHPNQSTRFRPDWIPFGCLLLGLGVVMAFFNGWVLVIGTHVVRARILSGVLLVASLLLLRNRSTKHSSEHGREVQRSGLQSWVVALLAAVVGAGTALGAFVDMGTETFILKPQGPDGCTAVVRESSFLMGGSGAAYAVNAVGIGRQAGGWSTDDGYRPIEAGSYTLDWHPSGRLIVDGAFGHDASRLGVINCN